MILTRGAQRAMIAIYFAVLAFFYVLAWSAPAIGLDPDAASSLVTAQAIARGQGYTVESLPQPVPQTGQPPLFPAALALFTLVSHKPLWLKFLPLACAAAWLVLTRRLLLKMGASKNSALLLLALTAASPTVIFLSTDLLPETLFALLATAALLELLEERALLAGVFAGLATLTRTGGVALIVACIFTLVARRRFRSAALFAGVSMLLAAPWFGWSLAHITTGAYTPGFTRSASEIFTGLAANEKLVVLAHNFFSLLASPFLLLTGMRNILSIVATVVLILWCFFIRRQLVPDLFVVLYSIALLFWIAPPERYMAPVLPLILWIVWRVFRLIRSPEALVALALIAAVVPLWADSTRALQVRANGSFPLEGPPSNNWNDMRRMFAFIRGNTPAGAVLLANLDQTFFLNTDRKAIRGFKPDDYDLLYAPQRLGATPDQLSNAILRQHIDYLVVTPDRGLPESASFHQSVEALERGGVIQPVSVRGEPADYSLFKVAGD